MRRAAAIIALAAVAGSDGAERGGGCLDAAALSEFVTARLAMLELPVEEAAQALLARECVTREALAELDRCGAEGLRQAVRAAELFLLGVDAVPAPVQPSAVPCVQLPSVPSVLVLEWTHRSDSVAKVSSFGIVRDTLGSAGSSTELALTPSEFAKCRSKGFCTFHTLIEPGRSYVYTITAHNAVGSSSSAEILCGTQPAPPEAARCAAPAEGGAAGK